MRPRVAALLSSILLLTLASPAFAATEYNAWIPFTDDFDSCTGERVVVTGTQHIVGQVTIDGSGQQHFVFHRNTQGAGVGTVSGGRYLLLDTVAIVELDGVDEDGLTVFTQQYETAFIRKGEAVPGDDLVARMTTRITITPDGALTVGTDVTSSVCR